jgi:hypothetical protein
LPTRFSGKDGSVVKKLFALLVVPGMLALGCGPAPTTPKSPPATTAPAAGAGTEKKGAAPDEKKPADKKGDAKGGE